MKQTKTKLLCLLLAALMLLSSLTACGKDKAKDSNLIKLGDYELLYKGACIMEDSDGNDAIVLALDFTNNGKENASYLWSVDETVMQNGVELEAATVFADYDTFETVIEGQFTDVAPGATLEVRTAYLLQDTTSPVEATFEQFLGKKSGKITIYLRHRPEPLENSVFATVSASLIFPVSLAFSLAGREQGKFFILLRLLYPAVVQKNALSPLSREHRYSVLCRPLNGQAFPEHP